MILSAFADVGALPDCCVVCRDAVHQLRRGFPAREVATFFGLDAAVVAGVLHGHGWREDAQTMAPGFTPRPARAVQAALPIGSAR